MLTRITRNRTLRYYKSGILTVRLISHLLVPCLESFIGLLVAFAIWLFCCLWQGGYDFAAVCLSACKQAYAKATRLFL